MQPASEEFNDISEYAKRVANDGYCVIPGQLPPDLRRRALATVNEVADNALKNTSSDLPKLATDSPIIWNLQNKSPLFLEVLFSSPTLHALLRHFLNDEWYKPIPQDQANYILRQFVARTSKGKLAMHLDSFIPMPGPRVISMQAITLLEDMSEENGCSVVVPGSHLSGKYVDQAVFDSAKPVTAKAGDIILWDSRIWHGARANPSNRTRWTMTATFTRWWIKQAFDLPASFPREFLSGLTDEQQAIIGFCSVPFADETKGIDFRRGFEALPGR